MKHSIHKNRQDKMHERMHVMNDGKKSIDWKLIQP